MRLVRLVNWVMSDVCVTCFGCEGGSGGDPPWDDILLIMGLPQNFRDTCDDLGGFLTCSGSIVSVVKSLW